MRVPVLSKQTVSTRPSASRVRGADQDAAPGEPAGGGHLGDGRDERQPFGYGGDGHGDPAADGTPYGAAAQQGQSGDQRAAGEGDGEGLAGQFLEAGLDAGGRRGAGGEGDGAAGLGAVAGVHDERFGPPGHDGGALEDHAGPPGDRGARCGVHGLGHGQGLAGERGFVDLQSVHLQQPGVRRYDVAGAEADPVPGPQPGGVDGDRAVAGDPAACLGLLPGGEAGEGPFGAQSLESARDRVDVHGADDEQRVDDGAEQCRGDRPGGQDGGERVVEFAAYGAGRLPGPAGGGRQGCTGEACGPLPGAAGE
ncbi:hypothetical protein SHKM778_41320 [Streptomyces sp. KM77-8]|uniref:Uncharacterized protein n=1 Tax=Streptomyces haneummycinicus TaxID=3074435 RepID=A0AAT9HJP0_9ACTN